MPSVPIIRPSPKPWDPAKRDRIKLAIDKLAARVRRELGAYSCLVLATFEDGEMLHIIDGGTAPTPSIAEFYDRAKAMHVREDRADAGFKAAGSAGEKPN